MELICYPNTLGFHLTVLCGYLFVMGMGFMAGYIIAKRNLKKGDKNG